MGSEGQWGRVLGSHTSHSIQMPYIVSGDGLAVLLLAN